MLNQTTHTNEVVQTVLIVGKWFCAQFDSCTSFNFNKNKNKSNKINISQLKFR